MNVKAFIWREQFVDKLEVKHHVLTYEAEAVFRNHPHFKRVAKGKVKGENIYRAMGKTDEGRYLVVFYIYKPESRSALVISARDMDRKERKYYDRK